MLLASGEGRYADQMERALYNNILASPALDGHHYFYTNPLMLRQAKDLRLSTDDPPGEISIPKKRPEWHDCACCPPNVMRLFSSFTHYLSTHDAKGIQIHHYALRILAVIYPQPACKTEYDDRIPLARAYQAEGCGIW